MNYARRKWRNAVDLHHLPEGTHSLAPRPGSLDRWTFQIGPRGRTCSCNLSGLSGTPLHWATRNWLAEPKLGAKAGAHGRSCTDTLRVLRAPSLHWTTWAKWCRVRDFHPQPLRSERSASCSWANAAKWRIRQDSHPQTLRSKRSMIIISPRTQKLGGPRLFL